MKKNTEIYLLSEEILGLLEQDSKEGYILSERTLSERFSVNRNLVRQAMERLINEYKLQKQGDGRVKVHFDRIPLCLQKFESLSETGKKIGLNLDSTLIEFSLIETNKKLSKKMEVVIGTRVWKIVRLREYEGQVISIETSYIPTSIVSELSHLDLEIFSLYDVLETQYSIKPWYSKESIRLVNSRYDESEYLGILVNTPVIMKKAQVFDKENRFIEYAEDILLPDYYYFVKRRIR